MAKRSAPTDLSELDTVAQIQEEGIIVDLLNMDGVSPLGFGIRVAGPDSSRADKARDEAQAWLMARESIEPLSATEQAEQNILYLANVSIEIVGTAVLDKVPLTNTFEDFKKLYSRFRFIRQQVDVKAGRREGFLSASEKLSSSPSETA